MKNLPYEDRPHLLVLSRSFFFSLSHRSRSCSESYSSWCIDSRAYAIYIYIYETSNAVLTFSSVFRTIRSLSCTGTKFQSRLVTSLFTARKGTATRINDRRFKGKLIRTSRVTRAPHQPSDTSWLVFRGKWCLAGWNGGLNHREEDTWPRVYRERVAMAR